MTTKFELQETAEPNLLDEMFDYSRPPRIQFDGPLVEQIDGKQVCFDRWLGHGVAPRHVGHERGEVDVRVVFGASAEHFGTS